jgi:hypothetical protein
MADIFGRDLTYGGGFKPEGTSVTFAGMVGGAIVRNISIGYEQAISRIWDLGTGNCFFVAGNTNGTWQIGKIAGPGASISTLGAYTVCSPGTMVFNGTNGSCDPATVAGYTLNNVITAQVSVSVSSEDMIINEGVGGTFLSLSIGK